MKNFEKIGLMLDCSRNAVPTVKTLKKLINILAKMGYNRLELYTEDTYEIKSRPYFGYLRGRYSGAELNEIDSYAVEKGIELTPCIQVLAHTKQIFRWPVFDNVRDLEDILLVDAPETYALIEDMFKSLAENFTSRNVNIGCDEAHMVGLGEFLDRFGFQDRVEIINRHIGKVLEIAKKHGFSCAMWSDMYFRLISGGRYEAFNSDTSVSPELLARVPKDVSLIYWEYCYRDAEHYKKMFVSHKLFGNNIELAGGAWKWTGFAPDNTYSIKALEKVLAAAKEYGIKTAMVTAWGDSGAEASVFSILPSLFYFARVCQGQSVEPSDLEAGFKEMFGTGFAEFMDIDIINRPPWHNANKASNTDKHLFYNDCFLGILDGRITGKEAAHYRAVSEKLKMGAYGEFSYIFKTIRALADVLELKADIGVRTRETYRKGDKEGLKVLAEEYGVIIKRIAAFRKLFEVQWFNENKPFGFEVQDMRLGGLLQRVKTCRRRLLGFCAGRITKISELEEDILPFGRVSGDGQLCILNSHPHIISVCVADF